MVDGTGASRYVADVAVEGARIVAVLPESSDTVDLLELPAGAVEVDATGFALAPGFIDMHAHSDLAVLEGARHDAKILQGVTTEVIAQDGLGLAPLDDATAATVTNTAVLVPQGILRAIVVGHENRPATGDEIAAMTQLLGEAMDAGAFGMSSGLAETPAMYAGDAELEALCAVVAERGGYWAPHTHSEGGAALALGREALEIGRRTGCPVHLTHATMNVAPDQDRASLEEAVRLLSGTPAERLGLHRGDRPRGVIRAGAAADLVLFDPETITAGATIESRREAPVGIVEVLIGGVPVVADGAVTGATPGEVLRMPPPAHRATVPRIDAVIDETASGFEWTAQTPVVSSSTDAGLAASIAALGGPGDAAASAARTPSITLVIDERVGDPARASGRVAEEAFRLEVAADGVEVRGASAAGVFRGATVLRQLRPPESDVARIPAGVWSGAPAYGWRGVMLDVARHFRPADDVRRLVDLLADHHLNVLHLHLSDDQGWRFEVPGFPRLTEVGARREATQLGHGPSATVEPGVHAGYYTSAELRELVAYAAERFVTIVPEVELPGHVQAALAAYPELGNTDVAEPVMSPWERFGVNRRTLAPTEGSLAFGRAAIDALCDLFEAQWIGIGGDEVPVTEWEQSAAAAERMGKLGLSTAHDVQPWFTAHFVEHVRRRGRTALAWDEVLEGDVPDGVQILAWRGPVAMREALRRGIPVVACPDMEAYLDYPQSESAEEPIRVGPPLPIERAYSLRVEPGAVGGQANVWTEHLPTRDRVDFAMFPRLAAIAERLWEGGEPPPFAQFARRLPVHLRRLAVAGVAYRPLDGPTPAQRRPGVPGKPLTLEAREEIVARLVQRLVKRAESYDEHRSQ